MILKITDPRRVERLELGIAALISGEYEQGTGCLHYVTDEGQHRWCCMGVLTDVACRNGLDLPRRMEDIRVSSLSIVRAAEVFGAGDVFLLPVTVAEFYGLPGLNPMVTIRGDSRTMGSWNDHGKATFADIAAGIRETYLRG